MFLVKVWDSVFRNLFVVLVTLVIAVPSAWSQSRPTTGLTAKPVALPPLTMNVEVPEFAALTATQRQKYLDEFTKLLELGLTPKKGASVDAEKSFVSAKRICDSDPRLEFAMGLVFTKNGKPDLAAEHFKNAKRFSQGALLAVDFEVIRGQLAQKKFSEAVSSTKELARYLSEHGDVPILSDDEQAAAHWVGRIAGYLETTTETSLNVSGLGSSLREELPPHLVKNFQAGQAAALLMRSALEAEFATMLEKDRELQEKREQTAKSRAESDREEAQSKQKDVSRAADTVTSEVNQKLNTLDSQVAAMRDRYYALQAESRRLSALMSELEETYEERTKDPNTGKQIVRRKTRIRNRSLHQQYSQQRAACDVECQRLSQNAQLAQMLRSQTAAAGNQQLNRLSGEAQRLQREEQLATNRDKAAERKLDDDSVQRSGKTKLLELRKSRLETFLPVTFSDYRVWLIASFE